MIDASMTLTSSMVLRSFMERLVFVGGVVSCFMVRPEPARL